MVVPAKSERLEFMFIEPFTSGLWVVTGAILMYTMFTVWFLEHQSNPEFSGPWKNQISTALWFTFSSLFFAHSKYQFQYTAKTILLCSAQACLTIARQSQRVSSMALLASFLVSLTRTLFPKCSEWSKLIRTLLKENIDLLMRGN